MTPYRSRLLARAKNAGMTNWSSASNESAIDYLAEKGILREFYTAFPEYDPDSPRYILSEAGRSQVR